MPLNCGVGEDSWESLGLQGDQISQSWRRSILNIHWKDWCWNSNTWATWCEELTHWKRPWCWEILKEKEKVTTEDEMVGWHHRLRHESEQAPRVGNGQGRLACCSPWGHKELDTTKQLKWIELKHCAKYHKCIISYHRYYHVMKIYNICIIHMRKMRFRGVTLCKLPRDPEVLSWKIIQTV